MQVIHSRFLVSGLLLAAAACLVERQAATAAGAGAETQNDSVTCSPKVDGGESVATDPQILFAPERSESFATSVSISGDWMMIGDPSYVEGEIDAVYLYRAIDNQWLPQGRILSPLPSTRIGFGYTVALAADWALIGAILDPLSGSNGGTIYTYQWTGDAWSLHGTLPSPPAGRGWGKAVLAGNLAAVSTRFMGYGWECSGGVLISIFELKAGEWIFDASFPSGGEFNQCSSFDLKQGILAVAECDQWFCSTYSLHIFERTKHSEWEQTASQVTPTIGDISIQNNMVLIAGYLFEKRLSGWTEVGWLPDADGNYGSVLGGAVLCPGGKAVTAGQANGCLRGVALLRGPGGIWQPILEMPDPACRPTDPYALTLACSSDSAVIGLPDWPGVNRPTYGHAYAFALPQADCDANGIVDLCELDNRGDCNSDSVLDECEPHEFGDFDFTYRIDLRDFAALQSCFATNPEFDPCCLVFDAESRNGQVEVGDLAWYVNAMTGP